MATYTTNLNLKKPAQSDKIRIADINNNMDDLDTAFGAIGNDSVATQIGDLQGAMAIVAVGNNHAAITAGQFVYVKSHETLDTGLYVASSNIAENGTLSSSNLTADTAGGLNALNSNVTTLTELTVTPGANVTLASWGLLNAYKLGRIVMIVGTGVKFSAASGALCSIAGISVSKYISGSGYVEGSNNKSFYMTASPTNVNRVDYEGVGNLNTNAFFQMILFVN